MALVEPLVGQGRLTGSGDAEGGSRSNDICTALRLNDDQGKGGGQAGGQQAGKD